MNAKNRHSAPQLQGPAVLPTSRQLLEDFRSVEPDDQALYLGRVLARATVLLREGAVYGFRRLLSRLLPEQDAVQKARGFTISQRAYVLDTMPRPGLLLRLVVRRRSVDVLLVACDPRRLAAFNVVPLPRMPSGGNGALLGKLHGEWWGGSVEESALDDWLEWTARPISIALPSGETLTISADEHRLLIYARENPTSGEVGLSEGNTLKRRNRQIVNGHAQLS